MRSSASGILIREGNKLVVKYSLDTVLYITLFLNLLIFKSQNASIETLNFLIIISQIVTDYTIGFIVDFIIDYTIIIS